MISTAKAKKVVDDDDSSSNNESDDPGQDIEEQDQKDEEEGASDGEEAGEEEMSEATESDCEVSSSDDDLKVIGSKKVQANYVSESSADGDEADANAAAIEESKEPASKPSKPTGKKYSSE